MAIPHSVNFSLTICKSNNMDNFKLDISKLTPVNEKNRVKGNYYLTSDSIDDKYPCLRRWHSAKNSMDDNGCDSLCEWDLWFLIPPGLPGFPVAELPEEIEINAGEWEKQFPLDWRPLQESHKLRKINRLPALTIPSSTRAEQVAKLKELLADFETF